MNRTTPSVEEKARSSLDRATKDHPWVNSLGMNFVPVAGTKLLFSVWDTRVQDFEMFVKSTGYCATEGMYSFAKVRVDVAGCDMEGTGL